MSGASVCQPEQPNVPLLAKSCVIGTDGILRVEYWDGRRDTFSQTYEAVVQVVDAEECIRQLYEFAYRQAERMRTLEAVAKAAKKLDEIEAREYHSAVRNKNQSIHAKAHIELHEALATMEEKEVRKNE